MKTKVQLKCIVMKRNKVKGHRKFAKKLHKSGVSMEMEKTGSVALYD